MSGIVDMWSSEVAKQREKGGASSGSSAADHQGSSSTQQAVPPKEEGKLFGGKLQGFLQEMRANSAVLLFPLSEASVSMIVECSSP